MTFSSARVLSQISLLFLLAIFSLSALSQTNSAPTLTYLYPNVSPIGRTTTVNLQGSNFTTSSVVYFKNVKVPYTLVDSTSLVVVIPTSLITLPGNGGFMVSNPGSGSSATLNFTAYIPIANNNMAYNPADGLSYVSVPSSAGAPYGNCVVSVDPLTGALGKPIYVGSEPNALAISADGKTLWVGLDGASAVRRVDLTAKVAGTQFTLGSNGYYGNPGTAVSLAALPGAPNSVVVAATTNSANINLAIYDNGVIRGVATTAPSFNATAVQVNGTLHEVYAATGNQYNIYGYDSTGLILKKSLTTEASVVNYNSSEMQVAGGKVFTDFGTVFDAEFGTLLGTFYSSGFNAAFGPTFADMTLGKVFIFDSPQQYGGLNQIQIFSPTTFLEKSLTTVPLNVDTNNAGNASTLRRWGTNGLALRNSLGVYSFRSNLVKNLASVNADVSVTLTSSGTSVTGSNTTYMSAVRNAGPATATNVSFTGQLPAGGQVLSATSSAGSCSLTAAVVCDLKSIAAGASVTVTVVVQQLTAGTTTFSVQAIGSENDPVPGNNRATVSSVVTGDAYNLVPAISSVNPPAIPTGSGTTMITVTGSNFSSAASIVLDGTALATSVTDSTSATAMVPSAKLANLGWSKVTVTNPAPGGGTSGALPLSVFKVLTADINHILYDPYSRKIMASVGSSSLTGNSIAAITPETGNIGKSVFIGSQPTKLALSSDGEVLYAILQGSESVGRFNMLTQKTEYTFQVPPDPSYYQNAQLSDITVQPGFDNTIALDLGSYNGIAMYDFSPATKTAAIRGQATGPYTGTCLHFLNANQMLAYSGALLTYTVPATGFQYYNSSQYTASNLNRFSCFELSGGLAFAMNGGVANPNTNPATQIGVYQPLPFNTYSYPNQLVAPDSSLQQVFFFGQTGSNYQADGINIYDENRFMPTASVPLDMQALEGPNGYNGVDLIRWGQDGLALLTSTGHIYLVRGGAVVPGMLKQNTAAVLSASSVTSIAHGSGNTLLTLTGSNFIPGVAVTWNGVYRTTTIVDATHVTVAIPASDLLTAGTGKLVATNPGATASAALNVTVN